MNQDDQDQNNNQAAPVVDPTLQTEPSVEEQVVAASEPEVISGDAEVVEENENPSSEPVDPEAAEKSRQKEDTTDESLASEDQTIIEEDVSTGAVESAGVASTEDDTTKSENTESTEASDTTESTDEAETPTAEVIEEDDSPGRWYVVHTYSGHENRVATTLKQRVEAEHLEGKIFDVLVPTQDKIEIKGGKKETVKEKIFPGYILVKMILDDDSWLAVRTTQGVTSFVGAANKPTPIPNHEVRSIVSFMQQGSQPTYKMNLLEGDTIKIVDGPFTEFIGKVDTVDSDRGKVRVLVSIFGRETPVELDFVQVTKL